MNVSGFQLPSSAQTTTLFPRSTADHRPLSAFKSPLGPVGSVVCLSTPRKTPRKPFVPGPNMPASEFPADLPHSLVPPSSLHNHRLWRSARETASEGRSTSTSGPLDPRTLHPVRLPRSRITPPNSWLRYLTTFNNTSLPTSSSSRHKTYALSSSYVVDPQWARKFTISWTSVVAAGLIVSLPYFYKSVGQGRALTGAFGVTESWNAKQYAPIEERKPCKRGTSWKFWMGVIRARAIHSWTLPGFDVSVGQSEQRLFFFFRISDALTWMALVLLIVGYFAALVSCILLKSQLSTNSNRAGKGTPCSVLRIPHLV